MRLQEIPDVFLKKRLSRRPHIDQGVATELLWRSIALLAILCALTTLSRRCSHLIRIKSLFFNIHDVMKTVGGVKIP